MLLEDSRQRREVRPRSRGRMGWPGARPLSPRNPEVGAGDRLRDLKVPPTGHRPPPGASPPSGGPEMQPIHVLTNRYHESRSTSTSPRPSSTSPTSTNKDGAAGTNMAGLVRPNLDLGCGCPASSRAPRVPSLNAARPRAEGVSMCVTRERPAWNDSIDVPWDRPAFERRLREKGRAYHDKHPFHLAMKRVLTQTRSAAGWPTGSITSGTSPSRTRPSYRTAQTTRCAGDGSAHPHPRRRRPGEGGIEAWLRLGEAVGLARESMMDEQRVVPGVRRPWSRTCDSRGKSRGPSQWPLR